MSRTIIIVESPAKAKTIQKYVGSQYLVRASMGHVRDLPARDLGVDIPAGFKPTWQTISGKGSVLSSLKQAVAGSSRVYLATDPDREGEAIAWHLAQVLRLSDAARIELHEITPQAVKAALGNPHRINTRRVAAQQARRILDRLVGYKLSPLLCRKVSKGLSAGRVQTVAVRLVCDREREILAFVPEEYWSLQAILRGEQADPFAADLIGKDGKKYRPVSQAEVEAVMADVRPRPFVVSRLIRQERRFSPPPPFTTSTLQQEAGRRLRMKAQRTMQIAPQLYEGIDLGDHGPVGLITYMRTDSVRVADSARAEAQAYIQQRFGAPYVGQKIYHAGNGAQDAHEAIRPTSVERTPNNVARFLDAEQLKLYSLIWERFVASQMAPCEVEMRAADIQAGAYTFRTTGSTVTFAGFTALTGREKPDRELPPLREGEVLSLLDLKPAQHFTEPPSRYTEATLIKALEERGIGRPSTYAPIVDTIQRRDYVRLLERYLVPTDTGFVTTDLLARHFTDIVSPEFTASMEQRLDEVESGNASWVQVLQAFYGPFEQTLRRAWADGSALPTPPNRPPLAAAPSRGTRKPAAPVRGRRKAAGPTRGVRKPAAPKGTRAPKRAAAVGAQVAAKCPRGNCGGAVVERKSRTGKRFWGCNRWPECSYVSWQPPG